MKPFNLERALAGDKVVTGMGTEVINIKYYPDNVFCVFGEENRNGTPSPILRTKTGGVNCTVECKFSDLFMVEPEPKVTTYWVNVYNAGGRFFISQKAFIDEQTAELYKYNSPVPGAGYIKTISFTVEE